MTRTLLMALLLLCGSSLSGQPNATNASVAINVGFRCELARKYGIHVGLDVAFGPDNTAVYVQIGGAWVRP